MVSSTASLSSSPSPSVRYDAACEQTAVTQYDLNVCSGSELSEVEAQLPRLLASARKVLNPTLVRDDQRRWLAYREAHCRALASYFDGGSIVPLIINGCERDLTIDRILLLRKELADLPR